MCSHGLVAARLLRGGLKVFGSNAPILSSQAAQSTSAFFNNLRQLDQLRHAASQRGGRGGDAPPPLTVGNKAEDFTATAVFPDNTLGPLTLSSYLGKKYVCLFFYPLDFTFVCPSEIIAFNAALPAFREKGAEVIGVSVDSQYSHHAWKQTPKEKGGIGNIQFPLVSDLTKRISQAYGVLHNDSVSLRGLFIIDKEGTIRHMLVNDLPIGRSVDEALRIIDAIQHYEKFGEVCPANWKHGERAMNPTTAGVAEYLKNASAGAVE